MHIILDTLSLLFLVQCVTALNMKYQRTIIPHYHEAVHNCKNIQHRVRTVSRNIKQRECLVE